MSSSSYLGHGAKYWADKYYELQTQTHLPDDPADLSWREKYLALEKECAHYQATLSDMRVEIEDLRSKSASSVPVSDHESEKWRNAYWKLCETLKKKEAQCDALSVENLRISRNLQTLPKRHDTYRGKTAEQWAEIADLREKSVSQSDDQLTEKFKAILSDNKKVLKDFEDSCNATSKKLEYAEEKIKTLQDNLKFANDKLDFYLHHEYKLLAKYLFLLSIFALGAFFLGRFSMDPASALYLNLIPCLVFLVSGSAVSYAFCSSKYADSRKAQKDSYDEHLKEQKETFAKDLAAIVDGLDLLSLSNAPESSYLDQKGLPHILVDGEDICIVVYTPTGEVFHQAKRPCIKYPQTTNLANLVPCSACARCNPIIPDLSWYGRCLSNAEILQRYGITIHVPLSSDEAVHRQQTSSTCFVSFGTTDVRLKKRALDAMINSQVASSRDKATPPQP